MSTPCPCEHGTLIGGLTWKRWEMPLPVPSAFGRMAIENGLFSSGNDFSEQRYPGQVCVSMLRLLWKGETLEDGGDHLSVWTVHDEHDRACGVVAWERAADIEQAIPFALSNRSYVDARDWKPTRTAAATCIGRVSLWLDPRWRGRGLMGQLLEHEVVKRLEDTAKQVQQRGALAYLRSSGATVGILGQVTDLPQPGFVRACRNESERLRVWLNEIESGCDWCPCERWGVPWKPIGLARSERPAVRRRGP